MILDDQVKVGMGIYSEPGFQILSPRPDMQSLLATKLSQLLNMEDAD
jgi:hypothetical protein